MAVFQNQPSEPTPRPTSWRRYPSPTNAFSKKIANLKVAIALHFAHYNLCRPHSKFTSDACDGGRDFHKHLDCRATDFGGSGKLGHYPLCVGRLLPHGISITSTHQKWHHPGFRLTITVFRYLQIQ